MVDYPTWTETVWKSAKKQGYAAEGLSDGQNVTSLAAQLWNDHKQDIRQASKSEAQRLADNWVSVE